MQHEDSYESFHYRASDGLKLFARVYEAPGSTTLPVVCLAGLTRNSADFHDLAVYLSRKARRPRTVAAFDYRGRGQSDRDGDWQKYDVLVEAGDVLTGMTALDIDHAAFIGTSRGGLIIHVLAALRPTVLKAAVLNDIGPEVDGEGLAQIRAYLERAPKPSSIAEAIAIQRSASGSAFSALSDADWERLVRANWRNKDGKLVPDYDPALLNTIKAVDFSKPLPSFWPQFMGLANIPVLAIRGANSRLLSAQTLTDMTTRHPSLQAITVEGQGHAPLLETGDLPRRIESFLDRADPAH